MGSSTPVRVRGWRAALGSTEEVIALYRIVVGALLLTELVLRFRYLHPFYSDDGTLPLRFLRPKVDEIYHVVCIHCWSGEMWYQQALLSVQVLCAFFLVIGYQARIMAILSWFLYLSSTLRNTWLAFILDRYFHYLLFYAMFLPLDGRWSIRTSHNRSHKKAGAMIVSMATVALKMQVVWIYLDAGAGKLMDPLGGWTYRADPLPALDTYARHTIGARYLYALLTPAGLRLLTPIVVYVELLSAPLALFASYVGNDTLVYVAIGLICSLHIGIAITLRNTILLSLIACCPCFVFLPIGWNRVTEVRIPKQPWFAVSFILILALVGGSIWFEVFAESCDQSVKHIWGTLLHNRWNVFVGAEEYVTWEIAPGRLADGSIVDVWGKTDTVDWRLPGTGAPCTSTSRPGRWRSFPYLAGIDGEEGDVLWGYLCKEWDLENNVAENPSRQLVEFNFFMLQADVLPNMGFSATRKRLIHSFKCVKSDDITEETSENDDDNGSSDTFSSDRPNDEAEL